MVMAALLPQLVGAGVQALTSRGGGKGGRRINPRTGQPYARRRRRGITTKQKADILFIRDAVGKTAAANYINLLKGTS